VGRGAAAAGAAPLAEVASAPVPQLVERMLIASDNDLAEALARRLALATGRPASFAGASEALTEVLGEAGVEPGAVRLADGSGLSREDRVEPGALTGLLVRAVAGEDERLAPLLTGLPVAGFDGTLAPRYRGGAALPAAGLVRAKTGTLNAVSALAGLVRTADGRLLAFDLTSNSVPLGANRRAERALDALAARFAACGCP
jgi:D-alanyl-D-alanine carboxypeptidase/D-alanyl-D-alanine-endopeptidase (penicillin-binding protein 4)